MGKKIDFLEIGGGGNDFKTKYTPLKSLNMFNFEKSKYRSSSRDKFDATEEIGGLNLNYRLKKKKKRSKTNLQKNKLLPGGSFFILVGREIKSIQTFSQVIHKL